MEILSGPRAGPALVILGPGDGARARDRAPALFAAALSEAGFLVARFDALPGEGQDPATQDQALARAIGDVASRRREGQALILGGFSRSARVSASLVEPLGALGLLALAYPFHGRHDPRDHGRVAQLAGIPVPALLIQGTRDSHGNQEQVRGYGLPPHIEVHWLPDANHALRPRRASGFTQSAQLVGAAERALAFIRNLIEPRAGL